MNIILSHGFDRNYSLGFIKGLIKNNVKCCVISSDDIHNYLIEKHIDSKNMRGSLNINRSVLDKILNIVRYYIRVIIFIIRNRNATIHMIGIFRKEHLIFEGIIFNYLLKILSYKYIYTVHNILPHNKENSRYYKYMYKLIYKAPDLLLAHTEKIKESLVKLYGVPEGKIKVISIGINEEIALTAIDKQRARIRLDLNKNDNVLLFFGNIEEYKGLDLLIRAIDKIQNRQLKLIIAGRFINREYRNKIYKLCCKSVSCNKIIIYDKFIPNEEIELLFKACDAIVLPYRNIDQSGVLFLALRFGLPIIASDAGSLGMYIDNDIGIIVKSNSVSELVHGINKFYNKIDSFKRQNIIHKSAKYKWDNICSDIRVIYEACPNNP
jgi:glycosyltransferase involved in cell wall biosynthesis